MADFNTNKSIGTREDLSDVIYNVDPFETPIMNSIGRGSCKQKYFEWQVDNLGDGGKDPVKEGSDFSQEDMEPTDRLGSTTQINQRGFGVTGTQEASTHAGRSSELAYQMAKVSKLLKLDIENHLAGGHNKRTEANNGNSLRKTQSISSYLSSNVISVDETNMSTLSGDTKLPTTGITDGKGVWSDGSGTPSVGEIQEYHLQYMLTTIYQNSGRSPNLIIVDPITKTKISNTFKGRATELTETAKDKTVQSVVDVYIGDFGTLRIMPSRQIGSQLKNGGLALALDTSQFSIDFLRPFNTYDLPKSGDYTRKALNVEWGLRSNNELSSGMIIDFAKGTPNTKSTSRTKSRK